jgi:hypothetical protein
LISAFIAYVGTVCVVILALTMWLMKDTTDVADEGHNRCGWRRTQQMWLMKDTTDVADEGHNRCG